MGIGKWVAAGAGLAAIGAVASYAQYRDTEEPDYEILKQDEAFQLRDYPPMIVAEVTHTGSRRRASGASFRRLAAYIFGQDRPDGGETIAMTAPVLSERVDQDAKIAMTAPVLQENVSGDTWRMRFVMPSKYTMDTLPTPPADITLTEVPARRVAAVRFNGYSNNADTAIMEQMLTDWMAEQGLTKVGGPVYAGYDGPGVPGPYRRNEVMFEVAAD